MSFTEFVGFFSLTRSEGIVLRYLTDAYRTLRNTVPDSAKTEELEDLIHWLGETIRQTDSSLLDEWEALTDPDLVAAAAARAAEGMSLLPTRPITGNERAFRVMVRNAIFRRVELAARDVFNDLAALERSVAELTEPPREPIMSADDWDEALAAYWDEHDEIGLGPDARGPAMLTITAESGPQPGVRDVPGVASRGPEQVRLWLVRQQIADPDGNHDWVIEATCDLDASDEVGEPVLLATAMRRL